MSHINFEDYAILYDDKKGAVYCPAKGRAMSTSVTNVKKIESYLQKYFQNELSESDKNLLEEYLQKSFQNHQPLIVDECPDLFQRHHLRKLEILLTTDCNLNCRYCYAHGGNYGQHSQRLSKNDAINYLNKLLVRRYNEVSTVMFFGGEPTICPSTIEAICDFFNKNVSEGTFKRMPIFTMVTNATLIDDYMASIIQKYDIHITVSLDGPKDINDELRIDRSGRGTYEKVQQGIEKMKSYGITPKLIEATYTKRHIDKGYSREYIKSYLKELYKIDRVLVADCNPGGYDDSLAITEYDGNYKNDDYEQTYNRVKMRKCLTSTTYSNTSCDAGLGSFALLPNGDIYPCHFFVEHPEFRIAHYNNNFCFDNYKSVVQLLVSSHRSKAKKCSNCWARIVCNACPAKLLIEGVEPQYCKAEKEKQKELILECIE